MHHQDGQTGLAEKHVLNQFRDWLDVAIRSHHPMPSPKFILVDGKVLVSGVRSIFQKILELWRQHRGMIRNQIELQRDPQAAKHIMCSAGIRTRRPIAHTSKCRWLSVSNPRLKYRLFKKQAVLFLVKHFRVP